MDEKEKWIVVGKILTTFGVKGNVKIISYCDDPSSIIGYEPIIIENTNEIIIINENYKNISPDKKLFIAEIPSSNIKETSQRLLGKNLLANKKKFYHCDENDFFYSDLEGCEVLSLDHKTIGKISGIYNFGAGDILEITKKINNSNILVNFNKNNFPKIDILKKKILSNFKEDDF